MSINVKKIIKWLTTPIFTIILLANGANVWADPIIGSLTVSPSKQKIVLIPGETYVGSINVFSPAKSEKDMRYNVSIGSFSESSNGENNDDYGTVDHISKSSYNQMMDWITLDKESGILSPNTKDVITYTINVPEDAPAGGQYASLIIKDEDGMYSVGTGVAIKNEMQILSIIYAEVAGETREEGVITENSIPSFLLNNPLNATSMVRNNGNVHTDAEYTLQVWPLFSDEEVCTNEEKPETSLILPETERFHAQTCELPSIGIFRAKQTVKIFGEESIIEKTIVICPIWLLFIIIFIVTIIVIWLITRIKSHKGNKD
ncbi:MAG: hypothetical protein Q4F56_02900 [Candidatus Saccharibacteria bacterium]|nr:hypothetical protein [Candidatus Saccharibacteria bacterium]